MPVCVVTDTTHPINRHHLIHQHFVSDQIVIYEFIRNNNGASDMKLKQIKEASLRQTGHKQTNHIALMVAKIAFG